MSATVVWVGSPACIGEPTPLDWIEIGKAAGAWMAGLTGLTALLKFRADARAAAKKLAALQARDENDLIEIAQRAAGQMIERHVSEIGRLSGRVTDLEAQNRECRAENRQLTVRMEKVEGENRQLRQQNVSLVDVLRGAGIDVTAREMTGGWVVVEGDRATAFKPTTKKPKE